MINHYNSSGGVRECFLKAGKIAIYTGGALAIPITVGSLFGIYYDGSIGMQLREGFGVACEVLGLEVGLAGIIAASDSSF